MQLGTVAQLIAVHGEAIRTSSGVRLQRPLAAHNDVQTRDSVLGHSPDKLMAKHVPTPDRSPTAESDVGDTFVAAEAPEDQEGLTTSGADEEAPPTPPAGLSQRPRPMSLCARGQNGDSEGRSVVTHGLKNAVHWI